LLADTMPQTPALASARERRFAARRCVTAQCAKGAIVTL
jgi:hypothetical protein